MKALFFLLFCFGLLRLFFHFFPIIFLSKLKGKVFTYAPISFLKFDLSDMSYFGYH